MEPIITYEGYQVLQNIEKSRDLLSNYYRSLGFTVVNPSPSQLKGEENKGETDAPHTQSFQPS